MTLDVDVLPPEDLQQLRVASVPALLLMHGGNFQRERLDGEAATAAAVEVLCARAKALSLSSGGAVTSTDGSSEPLLAEGFQALRARDEKAAATAFSTVLGASPSPTHAARALAGLARVALVGRDFETASELLASAKNKVDPPPPDVAAAAAVLALLEAPPLSEELIQASEPAAARLQQLLSTVASEPAAAIEDALWLARHHRSWGDGIAVKTALKVLEAAACDDPASAAAGRRRLASLLFV